VGLRTITIPPTLLARIEEIWHPEEVWLFGSRARGEQRIDSDWDLLVVVPDAATDDMVDPHNAWRRIRDLHLPVDLIPMRRSEFDEDALHLGSVTHIAITEGARVLPSKRS
jgi:predicted nucleotidyltransferase